MSLNFPEAIHFSTSPARHSSSIARCNDMMRQTRTRQKQRTFWVQNIGIQQHNKHPLDCPEQRHHPAWANDIEAL